MTYQGGPDMPRDPPDMPRDPNTRRAEDYIRRNESRWSMIPVAIGLALLLGLGYLLFGADNTGTNDPRTTERIVKPDTPPANRPVPTTPPAPNKQP
jgi:hypothetical protein